MMPPFEYRAKEKDAGTVTGRIIAEDKEDAIEKINQMGLVPVSVEDKSFSSRPSVFVFWQRVTAQDLYLFSRQMVSLLKAGVPILRALETIGRQTKKTYLRTCLESIRYDVQEGRSFSEGLANHPDIFSPFFVSMVHSGEESGRLKECISDVGVYLRQQNEFGAKVRMAMTYPIMMLVFGIASVVFILTNVMPKITKLFVDLNQTLPLPTVIVMKISDILLNYGLWVLMGLVVVGAYLNRWAGSVQGKIVLSRIKLKIPFLRDFWMKVELARFCRTLELLLKSGVSIVQALRLAIPVIHNQRIRDAFDQCQKDLVAGRSFGDALRQVDFLPGMMGDLITIGEESGSLNTTLNDIAETYEQETNEWIKVMTTLLEPLMIVFVGAIVGFIVVAMLLPIFQLDIMAQ
jgi:type II secretory pathway component PulF